MNPVVIATLSLFGLGLLAAVILAIAAKVFYVWEDPKISAVEDALLGANCGGCGFAGCSAAAEAVVRGNARADVCIAGGFEIATAVSKVMGVIVVEKEKEISVSGCRYGLTDALNNFTYSGVNDCNAAMMLFGGSKECSIGCIGLGTCAEICPFDAIIIDESRLPVVNPELCTGCGTCTKACPKGIIQLTSNTIRMTTEYTTDECTAPCQRACPTGIDIPKYIQAIAKSDFDEAVRIMMEKNPLLSICGRICPAPCETECSRNLVDQPVAINLLKKFVTDYEKRKNSFLPVFKAKKTEKKIAVIGGGAEGLTSAFFLSRLGHESEIFEANAKLGGLLRYVISQDRLPHEIIDWDIERILNIGVKAQTGKKLGKDFTLNSLFEKGKDAVLITNGGIDSRTIIQGTSAVENSIPGLHLLIDFLIASMKGKTPEIGDKVCIIGSDKSTEQAVHKIESLGIKQIHIITNKEIFEINSHNNITVHSNSIPIGFEGTFNSMKKLQIENLINKKISFIDTDSIIISSGRLPELVIIPDKINRTLQGWKTVRLFKGFSKNRNEGLFSTVESKRESGYTAVIKAVNSGRKIAGILHKYLIYNNDGTIVPQSNIVSETEVTENTYRIENLESISRNLPENTDSLEKDISKTTITDIGFSEKTAVLEAMRCLNCGLTCYTKVIQKNKF